MDYLALQSKADTLIRQVGLRVTVNRAGLKVGSAYGVFVNAKSENWQTLQSDLLAQTASTNKNLLVSGLAREPLVNDTIVADKVTYTVLKVEKVRPATTTLLYKLEVA